MIQAVSIFFTIYHDYKNDRNALAHATTIDENERNILISNLEKYTSLFYETLTELKNKFLITAESQLTKLLVAINYNRLFSPGIEMYSAFYVNTCYIKI